MHTYIVWLTLKETMNDVYVFKCSRNICVLTLQQPNFNRNHGKKHKNGYLVNGGDSVDFIPGLT